MAEKSYRLVKTNLNSQVYDILKEMIADQRFNPGSHINVEQLTHELGVSRTPIWEAIRRLEQEGIVVHVPHKGVRVLELTRQMAVELYVVREALEALAARLGAERATPEIVGKMETCLAEQALIVEQGDPVAYSRSDHEFHLMICEASENKLLTEIVEGLRYKTRPLAIRLADFFADFYKFHQEILAAFRQHNSEAAEMAMRRHHQLMLNLVRTGPWDNKEGVQA